MWVSPSGVLVGPRSSAGFAGVAGRGAVGNPTACVAWFGHRYPLRMLDTVYACLLVASFGLLAWLAGYAVYRVYQGQR